MAQEELDGGGPAAGASVASKCLKISEELRELRSTLLSIVPGDALISFRFDDRLHINIDLRDLRDLARVEALLPSLANGVFSNLRRSLVEHHSFRHRLTAEVVQ